MLVLDTNHINVFMYPHERRDRLQSRLISATGHEVVTTVITLQETLDGWITMVKKDIPAAKQVPYYKSLLDITTFFADWDILPFDEAAATEFDRLKATKIKRIGTMDLKIAAITLCNNAILLTANMSDFRNVPNLRVEDWLAEELEE